MKPKAPPTPTFHTGGHDELFVDRLDDAYQLSHKLHEPTVCPTCGAVYHLGRWQWLERPADAEEVICTACHRIADHSPAGYLDIEGEFAASHHEEVLRVLHHHEDYVRKEHPMERIMSIEESDNKTIVTTTDIHLAHNLAAALKAAFHGSLQLKYSTGENLLRAYWRR